MRLFQMIRSRMIDDAHYWYKMWSTWLAALWGLIVAAFWEDPGSFSNIVNAIPSDKRAFISPLVFLFAAAVPVIVRLLKQSNGNQPS